MTRKETGYSVNMPHAVLNATVPNDESSNQAFEKPVLADGDFDDKSVTSPDETHQKDASQRIAFFSPAPNYGGAQKVTINIANSLADRGYDVDYVAGTMEGEFLSEIENDVRTIDLDIPRIPSIGIAAAVPYLRSYLEETAPSVLFVSRTHTSIAAIIAEALSNVNVHLAVTVHMVYSHSGGLKSNLIKRLAARLWTRADSIIAVSEGVAEDIIANTNVPEDRVAVLNNPINLDRVRSLANETPDHEWLADDDIRPVVSVGRLTSQKDQTMLVRAFAEIHEDHPETRLIIIGKGPRRQALEALAESLGIRDRVAFPGFVDNPYSFMNHASVFALSSRVEALPTVLIEALACGCSIAATDCRYGPREILSDGEYGRLTPVGDPSAMADALRESLEDPIPPERARARSEHFSLSAGAKRYEEYIQQVTGDN